jgi:hypothetical protein
MRSYGSNCQRTRRAEQFSATLIPDHHAKSCPFIWSEKRPKTFTGPSHQDAVSVVKLLGRGHPFGLKGVVPTLQYEIEIIRREPHVTQSSRIVTIASAALEGN